MRRAKVLGATLAAIGAIAIAVPAEAQEVGADLGLFSSYVWRGLSLTNKPVAEPDLYVSFPAGKASVTVGGWANIDLGKYDDLDHDISESGGLSAFNFAEFDPYAEIAFTVGKATLTGGATAYIYPNKVGSATNVNDFGLLTSESNTVEIYGRLEVDAPLSPALSIYYDVDKIKGAYIEGSISHSLVLSEKVGLDLGALAGFSAGQGINDDPNSDESSNFDGDGFTHLDLSAGLPITAGAVSITPALHLVINGDDRVKVTSPTSTSDAKLWGGVTLSWSKSYGEEAEEAAPA
ncbi:MAG: TorF family putative porin, partial [Gemmatimonadales bacterium]